VEFFVASLVREMQWLPPADGEATVDMTETLDFTVGLVHFPIPTQNISSFTHHIKSFYACIEH
jgi:histidinol phosphatase-like PHP family hydrolase